MDSSVLVLNQNYEPLNICNVHRALVLVFNGKAEILELNHHEVRTPTQTFHGPSVIRMVYLIRRPLPVPKLSRREVFLRDNYTCQYCGIKTRELTLDHVIPKYRNGGHTWENLVSACKSCNHRKGGRTAEEARMHLLKPPRRPRVSSYYVLFRRYEDHPNREWGKFLGRPLPG